MTTTLVIGSDRGVGFEVAKRFGTAGHKVILVSRKKSRLREAKQRLVDEGITTSEYNCDVTDFDSVTEMFKTLIDQDQEIDNLIFNVANTHLDTALSSDTDLIDTLFKVNVLSAINCAKEFVHYFQSKSEQSIIFTGGGAAIRPSNRASTLSLTKAALRSYAYTLHDELITENTFVGLVTIQGLIDTSKEMAADKVAESFWQLYEKRSQPEIFYPAHVTKSEFV